MKLNKIYHIDCIEGLNKLKDESVDFILADYPFNIQDGRTDYIDFVRQTSEEFYRILKPNCVLLIVNNPRNIFKTIRYYSHFYLRDHIVLLRKGALRPAWHFGFQHNYCLTFIKTHDFNKPDKKYKWNGTKKNHDKTFLTDVIPYQNGYRGKGKAWHSQALPLDLTKKFIEIFSNKGDVVLDCFLGSGTTALGCKQLDRKYIGFEIKKEYVKMAEKRILEYKNKGSVRD